MKSIIHGPYGPCAWAHWPYGPGATGPEGPALGPTAHGPEWPVRPVRLVRAGGAGPVGGNLFISSGNYINFSGRSVSDNYIFSGNHVIVTKISGIIVNKSGRIMFLLNFG